MSKHYWITSLALAAAPLAAANTPTLGSVNFSTCIAESKYGKKEQENIETIRKQLSHQIEETEKALKELQAKFEDTEYLDSLSPKAEEEMKANYQSLQEDLMRYQNMYYQVLNHAQYQLMQKINNNVATAAKKIAESNKLDYVINKDACFYIRSDLDLTAAVIQEMDRAFEIEAKNGKKKISENGEEILDASAPEETQGHLTENQPAEEILPSNAG
jgi:outer membrane protein